MRVLLINPPSPEQLGAPLLGLQYVAASLVAHGCEVRVIDAAGRFFSHDADWIAGQARSFAPRIIGIGLFTRWVWHAYQLVERLRGGPWLLAAGGAHTTVRPAEVLRMGFDLALMGEAEISLVSLVDKLEQGAGTGEIPRFGQPAAPIEQLDELAPPYLAQALFDPSWYSESGQTAVPGGILTSRGCPARCTFCANYVTGRTFRYRSAESVISEIRAWREISGAGYLPFWDDALTANHARLAELCLAFERELDFPFSFGAITRANMISRGLLSAMRRAGLVHVNFGVESGDDEILRLIKKGIRTDQVVRALEWAKEEGLATACNFMLGFPQETPLELERTLSFMERIAPLVDSFSTMGVAVPFPGTPLYEEYHLRHGFTDWWLRPEYSKYTPPPPVEDAWRYYRYYIDDANLELDFFNYTEEIRSLIRDCLRFKAEHNLERMGLLPAQGPR
jgi:radical SAM superfamily enzyme YgiQ (UPF0313 family)